MKLTTAEFKNAITLLEAAFIERYSEPADKGAIAVAFYDYASKIDEGVASAADGDMIDCDKLRGRVNAFLKGAGGKMAYKPKINALARLLGVTIEEVVVTQSDADYFFDQIISSVAQVAGR